MNLSENIVILEANIISANSTNSSHAVEDVLVSESLRRLIDIVFVVVFCSVLSVFGIAANIINILVFYKQGLTSTVNIGFMALAISDLCGLLTLEWYCICFNPLFSNNPRVPFVSTEIHHLTAGLPHSCFVRITAWITVYMTAEKCLCIVSPLKIKRIITVRTTTLVLASISLVIVLALVPEYINAYFDWKFYPEFNRTVVGLVFRTDQPALNGLTFLLYSIIMITSFPSVIIFTAILVFFLRRQTKWRKRSTLHDNKTEALTQRDRVATATVMTIATVLIVTLTPSFIFFTIGFFVPGFSVTGKYRELFLTLASFVLCADAANSSVGVILYYRMSSRYRQTFHELFSVCRLQK
ncbi:type-1 angiotensin II receptor B-like [Physella acuta]|uniref:type-1 angiotensin II receptor B-like n=1 Tax=Physella acuta TaxID=109671 RepID=UPI0027DB5FB3|nr:type-1 angiotensin II receptor B-like [Physella acuta]